MGNDKRSRPPDTRLDIRDVTGVGETGLSNTQCVNADSLLATMIVIVGEKAGSSGTRSSRVRFSVPAVFLSFLP